ncbi:hypothetical protein FRC03_007366 [Tulasnella sp. 419]|nr:hypothetical protein FRC03_007366 [Tulasnella sp. 419]
MSSPWQVRLSSSRGVHYFYNTQTKESRWDSPPELTDEEVKELPGAKELLNKTRPQPAAPPGQVRASHLLVKHAGSRRPSSWKEEHITRSKDEAIAILNQYNAQIDGDPEVFARLASEHSDCSSHRAGGDLGWFGKGQMQRPFEEATYALEVGEISGIVDTDSGVHLILRTG